MSSQRPNRTPNELFERLVREHHAAVHAAALRVTRDDALALDVTQQVFVRVLEGKLDVAQALDVQRWLRCAAAREALMALRASASRRRREEQHAMRRPESFEDRSAESAETLGALRRALLELPDDLRAALVLRFQEELTFDEMGDVLAISAPSAHQRVQRGLEKLREKLTRLGFAVAAPQVETLLQHEGASSATPAGLEHRLLALSKAATGSTGALAAGALATALVVGVGAWRWMRSSGAVENASEVAASPEAHDNTRSTSTPPLSAGESQRSTVAASSNSPDAADARDTQRSPRATALENGRIEGRVVDELGFPLENVLVIAASAERDGKFAAESVEARSARDGVFALSVPVRLEGGQDYRLSVRTSQFQGEFEIVRVRAGKLATHQRLVVQRELAERPGEWRLEVAIRDSAGAPIEGALVQVRTVMRNASGDWWLQNQHGAQSSGDGIASLQGENLGAKLVTIDARGRGFAVRRERVELADEGLTRREFVLERGVDLAGSIVDDRGAPITRERLGANLGVLYATVDDADTWLFAEFPAPGRFVIPALSASEHTLRFRHPRWSSFTLAVTPGAGELALRLKRKDDVTGQGHHDAEIHGALFDAESGAPVKNGSLTTWLERVPDGSPALVDGDWAPLVMQRVSAQTAHFPDSGEHLPPPPPSNAFIYGGLEPGRYVVRVFADGYAPTLVGPIELDAKQIASGFSVRLTRGATVSGVVRDVDGTPLANARVHVLGDGELSRRRLDEADSELRSTGGRGFLLHSGVTTDAQGRFSRAHTPTDRVLRLYVLHTEREPAAGVRLELREGASVEHELRAGAKRER